MPKNTNKHIKNMWRNVLELKEVKKTVIYFRKDNNFGLLESGSFHYNWDKCIRRRMMTYK